MLNARSATAKKRELARQIRQSLLLERSMQRRLTKEFARMGRAAAAQYRASGHAGVDSRHVLNISATVSFYARSAGILNARYLMDQVGKKSKTRVLEFKATEVALAEIVGRNLSKYIGAKVKDITGTTRKGILAAIDHGHREGLGQAEIANLIEENTGGLIGANRAQTIARTEVHTASQMGSWSAAQDLGIRLKKEWVSAEDDRTRPSHQEANGQTVSEDSDFNIGGVRLSMPGDPLGPPEETINCRCVMVFHEDTDQDLNDESLSEDISD